MFVVVGCQLGQQLALMWVQSLVAFGYDIMIIGFKLDGNSRTSKNKLISIDYKIKQVTCTK